MNIKKRVYERYQTWWMMSHDIKVTDISLLADEWRADAEEYQTFADYIEEQGFDGSIWACFEEFISAEYLDMEFVSMLLPEDALYKEYLKDLGISLQTDFVRIPYRELRKGDILVLQNNRTTTVTAVYDKMIPIVWDENRGYRSDDIRACFRPIKEKNR